MPLQKSRQPLRAAEEQGPSSSGTSRSYDSTGLVNKDPPVSPAARFTTPRRDSVAAGAESHDDVSSPQASNPQEEVGRIEIARHALDALNRIAAELERVGPAIDRIAGQIAPEAGDVVGTPFVARKLGCTAVWVSEMARKGTIPKDCIVPGTGRGKPWKFFRRQIETWLDKR